MNGSTNFHSNFQHSFIYGDNSRHIKKHKYDEIRQSYSAIHSVGQFILDNFRSETQQLMERSEQLVRLMTHVCTQKLSGVFRVLDPHGRYVSSACGSKCEESTLDSCDKSCRCDPGDEVCVKQKHLKYECRLPCSNPRCNNWLQHHITPKWTLLQDGARGSGAGPPQVKTSKRKHSSSHVPSVTKSWLRPSANSILTLFFLLVSFLASVTESCSSRSTPKPRPSSPTLRPNVTFQTYACPPAYAAWFCLNGATCFTVKIQDAILYNCECAEGYMGPRCEFKDLDGSYLPARERVLLETASIAGGACIAIIFVFIVLFAMYVFVHKDREKRSYDSPYHDKKPLGDPCSQDPEYICTITPVRMTPVHQQHVTRENETPSAPCADDWNQRGIYLVRDLGGSSLCTCEKRYLSGHICINHSKSFILPAHVPNYM